MSKFGSRSPRIGAPLIAVREPAVKCRYYRDIVAERRKKKAVDLEVIRAGGYKVPDGLPALPHLPEGYSRWEYRGFGFECRQPVWFSRINTELFDRWTTPEFGVPSGLHNSRYIVAVKS